MEETVPERFRRLAAAFATKLRAVPPDGWDAPTPCAGWNVRDLVAHTVAMADVHLRRVGRQPRPGPDVAEDPLGAFLSIHDQIQTDLDDPVRAQATFDGRFGRWTFAEVIDRAVCLDLVVHGWDLARATGQDDRIDPADIAHVWHVVDLVGEAALRFGFAPAVAPPPGADEQALLLAHLGRTG
jgi:uncharacterized protein (TIGR03086 family)